MRAGWARLAWAALGLAPLSAAAQEVHVLKVQNDVYMLVGAGGNITAQIGQDGILLVNSGNGKLNDKVLEALRTVSDKPIHYIINTSFDADLTGGNEQFAKIGVPVVGGNLGNSNKGAAIVASENVLNRMSASGGRMW